MNKFISFEGIDGCGKTTQINLLSKYLSDKKISNSIIREPGDTKVSEALRKILLDNKNQINSVTEVLLFLSARSQLVNEIILPKLKNDEFILCDRYLDSTVAYQGYGHKLDLDLINIMNEFSTGNLIPSLTIIFNIDPEKAMSRIGNINLDRMESKGIDYFSRVNSGYIQIADLYPNRCKVIHCDNKNIIDIHQEIVEIVKMYFIKEE